jgi:hypothetical protein
MRAIVAGSWWSSRLVATAEEDRLSFRRNSIPDFWFRLSELPSWCLISHSQYKLEGNALHNNSEDKEVVTYQLGGEPKCGLSQRRLS